VKFGDYRARIVRLRKLRAWQCLQQSRQFQQEKDMLRRCSANFHRRGCMGRLETYYEVGLGQAPASKCP
jgi:hypothetical protein